MDLDQYLQDIPKAELHLHMEGAIQPDTLLALAERNRIDLPFSTPEGVARHLEFDSFRDFVDTYLMFADCLRTTEDFAFAIKQLGAELNRQNIRYAEITWTPQLYFEREISLDAVLEGLNAGRLEAQETWGVEMRWIPDLVRSFPDVQRQVLDWLKTLSLEERGIVALGLGGPEQGYLAAPFSGAFEKARELGLPANPHAGESAGPESIRESIEALQARRIGHGVRACEDPTLVEQIASQEVTLEVCPTSNIKLGIYPGYAEHPLKSLVDAGCVVTINSDDPVLFGTTLTEEYHHALFDCGLSLTQLETAILTALSASYMDAEKKQRMITAFQEDFTRLKTR